MSDVDRDAPSAAKNEPTRPLLAAKLPRYYRENAGILTTFLELAEDLRAETRGGLRRLEERVRASGSAPAFQGRHRRAPAEGSWCDVLVAASRARRPDAQRCGTLHGLEEWFRRGDAPLVAPSRVVTGCEVFPVGDEMLEVRPARAPAVVLCWGAEDLVATPRDFSLPERLLPVGCLVQAVRLGKVKSSERLPDSCRIPGLLFWARSTHGFS